MRPNKLNHLFQKFSNNLLGFALKLTGDKNEADDLYQDTALKILNNSEMYREGTNFKAWAMTIMKNIHINNYRKRTRRNRLINENIGTEHYTWQVSRDINHGEDTVGVQEIYKMINRLSEDIRRPFIMAHEGYKYEEIADELKTPLGTIKSRIFFARKKLSMTFA